MLCWSNGLFSREISLFDLSKQAWRPIFLFPIFALSIKTFAQMLQMPCYIGFYHSNWLLLRVCGSIQHVLMHFSVFCGNILLVNFWQTSWLYLHTCHEKIDLLLCAFLAVAVSFVVGCTAWWWYEYSTNGRLCPFTRFMCSKYHPICQCGGRYHPCTYL